MDPDSSTGKKIPDDLDTQATEVVETPDINTGGDGGQDAISEAQSSSAQDAVEDSLEAVIRNAVNQPEADPPAPESSDGKREKGTEEGEAKPEAKAEGEADPDANVPFHKHPRWQEKLRKERELTRERDTYKEGHERFQQIERFMTVNQLAPEEVAQGFEIMALMRGDPERALEALLPYVRDLEIATGRKLPDDLKQRVDDGVVDEDTARETARLRTETQRRAAEAEQARRQAQQVGQQTAIQAIQSAATAVEQEIRTSDPDYARKQPFIMDRVRSLIAAERPQSPEQAANIVRRAHREVTEALKPMVAQRKPVATVRSGDAVTTGRSAPKSLLDVVTQAANANT